MVKFYPGDYVEATFTNTIIMDSDEGDYFVHAGDKATIIRATDEYCSVQFWRWPGKIASFFAPSDFQLVEEPSDHD